MTLLAEKWPFWVTFLTSDFGNFFHFKVAFRTLLVAFGHLLGLMSLLHKKEGPLKLLKTPKSTFYRIWSVFGGVSNLLPITAQFHGSVLQPDSKQKSAKRVLKSKTPRTQFCLRCTFPRFDTAVAKTFYQRKTLVRIIIKLLTVETAFTDFSVKSKLLLRVEKYF